MTGLMKFSVDDSTKEELRASYRDLERDHLAMAQIYMREAALQICRAAEAREKQGDEHAARDASTYCCAAVLLRGDRDAELVAMLRPKDSGAGFETVLAVAKILDTLDPDALARMIKNEP